MLCGVDVGVLGSWSRKNDVSNMTPLASVSVKTVTHRPPVKHIKTQLEPFIGPEIGLVGRCPLMSGQRVPSPERLVCLGVAGMEEGCCGFLGIMIVHPLEV
jgi:hypothetical protein